jgi:methionyl-tRNA formyltransferase
VDKNKKVYIATSRHIGSVCTEWAIEKIKSIDGFELCHTKEECDIFISVLYEKLLKNHFIKDRKCFNFHPGILPEYRGAGAYSWTLINKEKETGITLHVIDEGIDSGNIIDIQSFKINHEADTAETLFDRGNELLFDMFRSWFEKLLVGEYKEKEQDSSNSAIYYRRDLNKAKDISNYIRAFTFSDKESAYFVNNDGEKVYIDFWSKDENRS